MHGDAPVRLDDRVPDLRENDFTVGAVEVVVAVNNVLANDLDVEERLFDKIFHTLYIDNRISKPDKPSCCRTNE